MKHLRPLALLCAAALLLAALAGCKTETDQRKEQVTALAAAMLNAPDPGFEEALLHFGEPGRPIDELTDAYAAMAGENASPQLVELLVKNLEGLHMDAFQHGFTSTCGEVSVEENATTAGLYLLTAQVTISRPEQEDAAVTISGKAQYGEDGTMTYFSLDHAPLASLFR